MDRNPGFAKFAYGRIKSLSARRAWIEMMQFVPITTSDVWSLSARRAWIEIELTSSVSMRSLSLSARRAWIEIWHIHGFLRGLPVALRKESVDRNRMCSLPATRPAQSLSARRAWIEIPDARPRICGTLSLSARRAWIEIVKSSYQLHP